MSRDLYIKATSVNVAEWVRPTDWLTMPTLTSSDDEFVGLYAIFPNGNNFATLTMTTSTGTYDVDWGDGVVDTVVSGSLAQHTYDFATYDVSNTTLTSRGYKQAFITVTANTGLFRTANFQTRRVTSPVQNQPYATGWLDVVCSFPNLNTGASFTFGGQTIRHSYLERFDCKSIGSATSILRLCNNCFSLQSVFIPNTVNVTTVESLFDGCYALKIAPFFNTENVTVTGNMFFNCYSLIVVPLYNTIKVTSALSMFQSCYSLITVPLLNFENLLVGQGMFQFCYSLRTVPLFNFIKATNLSIIFSSCFSLESVPLFNTPVCTNWGYAFQFCYKLQSIPALSTASITTVAGSNFDTIFRDCHSLDRIEMVFARQVSMNNCQLSQTALVEIFNNLVDRTATTSANISIVGNWGASALTLAERDIALNKNWTITG